MDSIWLAKVILLAIVVCLSPFLLVLGLCIGYGLLHVAVAISPLLIAWALSILIPEGKIAFWILGVIVQIVLVVAVLTHKSEE
jgi:hypothetical protein